MTETGSGAPEKAPDEITIELGGERRRLYYDLNALTSYQDVMDGEDLWVVVSTKRDLSPRQVRAALWAGLLLEIPALTLEEAGRFIVPGERYVEMQLSIALAVLHRGVKEEDIKAFADAVREESRKKAEEEAAAGREDPPKKRSTGGASSATPSSTSSEPPKKSSGSPPGNSTGSKGGASKGGGKRTTARR